MGSFFIIYVYWWQQKDDISFARLQGFYYIVFIQNNGLAMSKPCNYELYILGDAKIVNIRQI